MIKKWFCALFAGILLLSLSSCTGSMDGRESIRIFGDYSSVLFVKNPAPPACKKLTDSEEIDKLLSGIRDGRLELLPEKDQNAATAKGWSLWIRFVDEDDPEHNTLENAKSLAFYGENVLCYENTFYQADSEFYEDLIRLYGSFSAEEMSYADFLAEEE